MISRREFGQVAATALGAAGQGRSAEAAPPSIALRAGPVTALFEPAIAFLRYVKYGDSEIIRGLYAAVRDKVWGTVAPRVTNVVTEARADSFRLTFDVDNVEGDIDFGWRGVITGDAKGTIRFEFNGRARSTFLKNRLGFAVLHPIKECAGKPCTIEKSGGIKETGTFPDAISPHQPFLDMTAVSHEVTPGVTAEVRFEGETFEMEDHRNWTDGNYKTYCTPLSKPFPVEVRRGQEVKQAVTIRLTGIPATAAAKASSGPRELRIEPMASASPVKLPAIGLGFASDQAPLTAVESTRLAVLRPAHLRVDLRLSDPAWEKVLLAASRLAPVEAALVSGEPGAIASLPGGARVARWLIFSGKQTPEARQKLRGGAPIVVGTNEYFTELNRERPDASAIDGSCYSINPQVHAFDDRSLVENLEAQADTVRSAKRFLAGKPIHVTPVTLRPRFNPQAKGAPEPVVPGRLPSRIDPRQASLFGAVWTLGSIKYLSEAGAASITYYQTHGWAGLMETASGSPMPDLFASIPGAVFPLYHVLADVAEFAGGSVQPLASSAPLETCALALEQAKRRRVMIANLTAEPKIVTVDAAWIGPRARVVTLDEQSAQEAMRQPERFRRAAAPLMEAAAGGRYRLAMLPYSVTRLDRA